MNKFVILLMCSIVSLNLGCHKKENNKKRIRTCFHTDPTTLDARKSGDYISSTAIFMLFQGLMHTDKNGEIVPAIAKSYEISEDQKKYTFYLRDAKWSDGKTITAHDFEKSWKKILDPTFPSHCPHLFYPIKNAEKAFKNEISIDEVKIKAINDKTLIVELENPTPYFLALTSFCTYFPIPTHIDENNPNWSVDNVISSGPFILKKWDFNNELLLEKNTLFYDHDKIKIDELQITIIGNENTALQMYENDELDVLSSYLSPIEVDSLGKISKRNDLYLFPIGGFSFCTFNTNVFPFNNVNIRKAFAYAINRQSIVDNITQLNELISTRLIPPILMNDKNKVLLEDNQTILAKSFLEKGLEELNVNIEEIKVKFTYGPYSVHKKEGEALKQIWEKALGIKIDLEFCEEKVMLSRLFTKNYQFAMARLIVQYNDPMNIFERFKYRDLPKNYASWENKEYISLLDQSLSKTNANERQELLEKAEEILMNEAPIAPIYNYNYVLLTKPHVKGIYIGPVSDLYFDDAEIIKEK